MAPPAIQVQEDIDLGTSSRRELASDLVGCRVDILMLLPSFIHMGQCIQEEEVSSCFLSVREIIPLDSNVARQLRLHFAIFAGYECEK